MVDCGGLGDINNSNLGNASFPTNGQRNSDIWGHPHPIIKRVRAWPLPWSRPKQKSAVCAFLQSASTGALGCWRSAGIEGCPGGLPRGSPQPGVPEKHLLHQLALYVGRDHSQNRSPSSLLQSGKHRGRSLNLWKVLLPWRKFSSRFSGCYQSL